VAGAYGWIPAALAWGRARPIGTRGFRDFEGPVSERERNEYANWLEMNYNGDIECCSRGEVGMCGLFEPIRRVRRTKKELGKTKVRGKMNGQ
jgi:hypothetical protein